MFAPFYNSKLTFGKEVFMKKGWISLNRKLIDTDLWLSEVFTRGQAWVDLLLLANHENGYIRVSGQKIDIDRGQCGWSQLNLSKRWKWSRGKTSRFLKELVKDERITQKTDNRNTIITICNYSIYQDSSTPDRTPDRTPDGHQTDIKRDTNNKNNNNNNDNKLIAGGKIYRMPDGKIENDDSLFERFWKNYPNIRNKGHKGKAKDIFLKQLKENKNYEEIGRGITKYRRYCEETGEKNQDMFRWIRDECWKQEYKASTRSSTSNTITNSIDLARTDQHNIKSEIQRQEILRDLGIG